jgi:Flp pilus assembly protein TadD
VAWHPKGVALYSIGQTGKALAAFEQALDIRPGYAEAWFNKAVALDGLGRHDEAKLAHQRVQQIDTTRPAP